MVVVVVAVVVVVVVGVAVGVAVVVGSDPPRECTSERGPTARQPVVGPLLAPCGPLNHRFVG